MKKQQLVFYFLMFLTTSVLAQEYSIGILAKRGTDGFYDRWLMHAAYLERVTGHPFTVKPLKFIEVEPAVASGEIDFLLVNSSMFVTMKEKYKAKAIATMINSTLLGTKTSQFGGVIFTSADSSGINSLNDIKGKPFIAVKKTSLGGYQMALKEFQDQGIDLNTTASSLEFANTHDNVVKKVLQRPGTIGTVRTNILEIMDFDGSINMNDIKILNKKGITDFPFVSSTSLYPEWPFAALEKTDKRLAQQVADALIQLRKDDLVIELAAIGGWVAPLDYSQVKELLRSIGLLTHN